MTPKHFRATVTGYWYERSPLMLNNCPNCDPLGTANDDNDPDAPYLLPVNMDPATGAANPVLHSVTLIDGVSLPGRDVFGFPVMQPLCGTIPKPGLNAGDPPIPAPSVCPAL